MGFSNKNPGVGCHALIQGIFLQELVGSPRLQVDYPYTSTTWEAPRRGDSKGPYKSLVWKEWGSKTVVDLDGSGWEPCSEVIPHSRCIRIWIPDPGEVWHSAEFVKDYQQGSGKSPEAEWVIQIYALPFLWNFRSLPQTESGMDWLSPDSLDPYGGISYLFSLCLAEKGNSLKCIPAAQRFSHSFMWMHAQ